MDVENEVVRLVGTSSGHRLHGEDPDKVGRASGYLPRWVLPPRGLVDP